MSRRDATFAVGCVLLSATVPGVMLAFPAFGDERVTLGVLAGWGLALAIMVPSYVLLSRTLHAGDNQRFYRAFMLGTAMRFAGCILGTLAFGLLVPEAPMKTFVMAFFLGYFLLMALELPLAQRRAPDREERA